MNLQFYGVDTPTLKDGQPAPEAPMRATILHEFGHALGLQHEHQSPNANCDAEIDWDAAYKVGADIGWDKGLVDRNFRQLASSTSLNATAVDRKSIMHYSLPPTLFKRGKQSACFVPENLELSQVDRTFIASIYPKDEAPMVVSGIPPTTGCAQRRQTAGSRRGPPSPRQALRGAAEAVGHRGGSGARAGRRLPQVRIREVASARAIAPALADGWIPGTRPGMTAAGGAAPSHGVQPAVRAGVEGRMTGGATGPVTLIPASVPLADWRAIYEGAGVRLDPACATAIDASARAVEAIVAKGEPVYGINTGFGKLASVRIAPADLAQLQRNIVLSHAAGVGEPAPEPIVRLMLALKLASLAQGASGVRRRPWRCWRRCSRAT